MAYIKTTSNPFKENKKIINSLKYIINNGFLPLYIPSDLANNISSHCLRRIVLRSNSERQQI